MARIYYALEKTSQLLNIQQYVSLLCIKVIQLAYHSLNQKINTITAAYLCAYYRYLRQLNDISPHGVEHILELVYNWNKRLHHSVN